MPLYLQLDGFRPVDFGDYDQAPGPDWHECQERTGPPPPGSLAFGRDGTEYVCTPASWETFRAERDRFFRHWESPGTSVPSMLAMQYAPLLAIQEEFLAGYQALRDAPSAGGTPAAALALIRTHDATLATATHRPGLYG